MAFPTTSVLDNANRADEGPPPSASWGNLVAGLVVSSNQIAPSGPGFRSSYWLTAFNANCEVFATIGTNPSSNRTQTLFVRLHDVGSGTTDGYGVRFNKLAGTDTLEVVIMTNGSLTAIGSAVSDDKATAISYSPSTKWSPSFSLTIWLRPTRCSESLR